MRNRIIWNVVVAAVLGGVYGALLHLLVGRGGFGRAPLPKSRAKRAVESFEARPAALPEWQERAPGRSRKEVQEIAHDAGFRGVARLDDEHACWAARTMYDYLPQLPGEARRDLTRVLFTS